MRSGFVDGHRERSFFSVDRIAQFYVRGWNIDNLEILGADAHPYPVVDVNEDLRVDGLDVGTSSTLFWRRNTLCNGNRLRRTSTASAWSLSRTWSRWSSSCWAVRAVGIECNSIVFKSLFGECRSIIAELELGWIAPYKLGFSKRRPRGTAAGNPLHFERRMARWRGLPMRECGRRLSRRWSKSPGQGAGFSPGRTTASQEV